jgi:hypothetical protein
MAKKSSKSKGRSKGQKNRIGKKKGASARTARRTAGAKTPKGKARRKKATNPPRPGKKKSAARTTPKRGAATKRKAGRSTKLTAGRSTKPRAGGTGRESELAQTPETGRTKRGPTNPMPTKRSTGTPAGAGTSRQAPGLDRARKQLRELDETVPSPPSSLNPDRRRASAARSGRHELQHDIDDHNEVSPEITAGDVDADWEDAYAVGDEAPGGDNPTPDQDRVDDIGKALGVQYEDNEELKAADKIAERDKHRWELDPASSDDYPDRD